MSNVSCNFALAPSFNVSHDLTWSFEYSLSGIAGSSGGLSTFLFNAPTLVGGGDTNALGYTNTLLMPGVSGAEIGVGFDSTGRFSSRQYGVFTGLLNPPPNTVGCRVGSSFTYLSSAALPFNLLETSENFRTIRFHLTDLGQTLNIHYKDTISEVYTPLASFDTGLVYLEDTWRKIGIGMATPVSNGARAILKLRNLHYHGTL